MHAPNLPGHAEWEAPPEPELPVPGAGAVGWARRAPAAETFGLEEKQQLWGLQAWRHSSVARAPSLGIRSSPCLPCASAWFCLSLLRHPASHRGRARVRGRLGRCFRAALRWLSGPAFSLKLDCGSHATGKLAGTSSAGRGELRSSGHGRARPRAVSCLALNTLCARHFTTLHPLPGQHRSHSPTQTAADSEEWRQVDGLGFCSLQQPAE